MHFYLGSVKDSSVRWIPGGLCSNSPEKRRACMIRKNLNINGKMQMMVVDPDAFLSAMPAAVRGINPWWMP